MRFMLARCDEEAESGETVTSPPGSGGVRGKRTTLGAFHRPSTPGPLRFSVKERERLATRCTKR